MQKQVAVIGGVSVQSDFSTLLINKLIERRFYVVGIARNAEGKNNLVDIFADNSCIEFAWGDLNDIAFVKNLSRRAAQDIGQVTVYIHNATILTLSPFLETRATDFDESWRVTVKTAVAASHALLPPMLERGNGTLIFTGATASIKGNAKSSPFAVAKFGLRGLSQSLVREFGPRGIHVVHVIVDGMIAGKRARETFNMPDKKCIKPDALADLYIHLIEQDASCWTQEIDLRPDLERF